MNRTRTTVQDRWLCEYLDLEDDFAYRREREQHRREAVSVGARHMVVDDDPGVPEGHESHAADGDDAQARAYAHAHARGRSAPAQGQGEGETMKCPRCGDLLMQVAVEKVKAERCSSCSGVYFDSDELDFLLHAHEPTHLLDLFRSLLTRALPRSDLRPPHLEL